MNVVDGGEIVVSSDDREWGKIYFVFVQCGGIPVFACVWAHGSKDIEGMTTP